MGSSPSCSDDHIPKTAYIENRKKIMSQISQCEARDPDYTCELSQYMLKTEHQQIMDTLLQDYVPKTGCQAPNVAYGNSPEECCK